MLPYVRKHTYYVFAPPSTTSGKNNYPRLGVPLTNRLQQGPQRQLVNTFIDMAVNWDPLDKRAILRTGMLTKPQRAALHPHIQRLPTARS